VSHRRPWTTALLLVGLAACSRKDGTPSHGSAADAAASAAKTGPCASGGGKIDDALTARLLPRVAGDHCVEPKGETRTYGTDGKLPLDEGCTSTFGEGCAAVAKLGLVRLASVRYVGGTGSVDVVLSSYTDKVRAYEAFTERALGGSDPALATAPKPLALAQQTEPRHGTVVTSGPVGAIGGARADVWVGAYVVELRYDDPQASKEALEASAAKVLPGVAEAIVAAMPPPGTAPGAINALPEEHLVPVSVKLAPMSILGIVRAGPLAIGSYSDDGARYRLAAYLTADEALARATLDELRRRPGATPIAVGKEQGVVLSLPDAPHARYVFARARSLLFGVGDDDFAISADAGTASRRLGTAAKVARLEKWIAPRKEEKR
jgi:hypothetical protein